MKRQIKSLIITTIVFFIVIFVISSSYRKMQYLADSLKGFFIEDNGPAGTGGITIIDPALKKDFVSPYAGSPSSLQLAGPFLFYRAAGDTTVRNIALEAIEYTRLLKAGPLEREIASINGIRGGVVARGRVIVIPNHQPALVQDVSNKSRPGLFHVRGLYFSGGALGNGEIIRSMPLFRKAGINTIVFDAKDIPGIVTYKSSVPRVIACDTHKHRSVDNLKEVLRILKINGFYTVARIAVFRDHLLAETDPSLAIQSARGGVWNRGEKEIWCDPTNRKVQDYNIALAAELCGMGADEIQFDYIRFPTVGNQSDARYRNDFGAMGKQSVIAHFLKRARREISSRNALVSIDIFGVVAWGKEVDIRKTGQQIGLLASNCDIISPMLYPSHFNDDFDGFANPGDNPYHFIYNGCRRVIELSGKKAAVRPWLQAFKWRVSRYDSSYVIKQIQASDDSGAMGYLFWNAANNYGEVLEAMDILQKARAAGPGKASAENRVN